MAIANEKLHAVEAIVKEQLDQGHIEYSTSPWNTPIFTIKKKSGKWHLLHDLREVNKRIQFMGSLQCSIPNPNLIPQHYELMIVDLKDCFFTIPLAPQDRGKLPFQSLCTTNTELPKT